MSIADFLAIMNGVIALGLMIISTTFLITQKTQSAYRASVYYFSLVLIVSCSILLFLQFKGG